MIDPLGGVQQLEVPYRPLYATGIGEGTVVKVDHGLYVEVVSARFEMTGKRSRMLLNVQPIDTGRVLSGFSEYARPVFDLTTMQPTEV